MKNKTNSNREILFLVLNIIFLILWIVWLTFWKSQKSDIVEYYENQKLKKILVQYDFVDKKIKENNLSYPECFNDLWYYFWPIVLFKVNRDIRIDFNKENFQDMEKFKKYNNIPLPPNKFLYKSYSKNTLDIQTDLDNTYCISYLDLTESPQIIKVPKIPKINGKKRYWSMQIIDAWNNILALPGSLDDSPSTNYIIAGPKYKHNILNQIITTPYSSCWIAIIITTLLFLISSSFILIFKDEKYLGAALVAFFLVVLLGFLLFSETCQDYYNIYNSKTNSAMVIVRIETNGKSDKDIQKIKEVQEQFKIWSLYPNNDQLTFENSLKNLVPKEYYNNSKNFEQYEYYNKFGIPQRNDILPSNLIIWNKFTSKDYWNYAVSMLQNNPPEKDKHQETILKSINMISDNEIPFNYYDTLEPSYKNILDILNETGPELLKENTNNKLDKKTNIHGYIHQTRKKDFALKYLNRAISSLVGFGMNEFEETVYNLGSKILSPYQQKIQNLVNEINLDVSQNLNGENNYKIEFNSTNCRSDNNTPPVYSYWSLTVYTIDGYATENSHVTSEQLDFKEDTKNILYLSNTKPKYPKAKYWIKTPKEDFYVLFRYYEPQEEIIKKDWLTPLIKLD